MFGFPFGFSQGHGHGGDDGECIFTYNIRTWALRITLTWWRLRIRIIDQQYWVLSNIGSN